MICIVPQGDLQRVQDLLKGVPQQVLTSSFDNRFKPITITSTYETLLVSAMDNVFFEAIHVPFA